MLRQGLVPIDRCLPDGDRDNVVPFIRPQCLVRSFPDKTRRIEGCNLDIDELFPIVRCRRIGHDRSESESFVDGRRRGVVKRSGRLPLRPLPYAASLILALLLG